MLAKIHNFVLIGIDPIACEVEVYPVSTISQAVSFLNEQIELDPYELGGQPYTLSQVNEALDFADVRGQEAVKRAITISAAGGHNLLQFFTVSPMTA